MKSGFSLQDMPKAVVIVTYLNPVAKNHQLFDEKITVDNQKTVLWQHAHDLIMSAIKDAYKHGIIELVTREKDGSQDEDDNNHTVNHGLQKYRSKDVNKQKYFDDPLSWWLRRFETKVSTPAATGTNLLQRSMIVRTH